MWSRLWMSSHWRNDSSWIASRTPISWGVCTRYFNWPSGGAFQPPEQPFTGRFSGLIRALSIELRWPQSGKRCSQRDWIASSDPPDKIVISFAPIIIRSFGSLERKRILRRRRPVIGDHCRSLWIDNYTRIFNSDSESQSGTNPVIFTSVDCTSTPHNNLVWNSNSLDIDLGGNLDDDSNADAVIRMLIWVAVWMLWMFILIRQVIAELASESDVWFIRSGFRLRISQVPGLVIKLGCKFS